METYMSIISHLADKEYQKRTWIRGEPPGTDFDETVNLYADIGDPILENYKDYRISDREYQILGKLRNSFEVFWENNHWPPKFIDTPEWDEITKMAKEVLEAFHYRN
jgi:hypothetical protein